MPPGQDRPLSVPVRARRAFEPGCLWMARLHLAAKWVTSAQLLSWTACDLDTIFAAFRRPALSRWWAASHSYPELANNEYALSAPEQDASCQPLQPTSVVTSTRWIPNSQAHDLRRCARRDLVDTPTDACARVKAPNCPRRRRIAVAGISDLGWPRSWRRVHQRWSRSPFLERRPVARALTRADIVGRTRARWGDHRRSLSQPQVRPVARAAPRLPESASPAPRQRCSLFRSGAPSAGRSCWTPPFACARGIVLQAATGTLAWPPRPSFRHAFTRILAR